MEKTKKMITKWSELPIGKFQEIQKIKETDDLDAAIKINAILNDLSYEEALELPLAEMARMSQARKFLEKAPVVKITKKRYNLGGKIYEFDGNPFKISTAQFIDLQEIGKDDLVSALSIFLIPEGKTYNKGYDIQDVKDDIVKYLSAEEGLGMANFFTTLLGILYRRAVRKAKRMLRKAKKAGVDTKEAEKLLQAY